MNISIEENERLEEDIENYVKIVLHDRKEIERLKELCDKYEEEHKTTFETWQKDIKENEHLRTALNSKESIIKEVREYILKEDEWVKNSDYRLLKTEKLLGILDKESK